ncbi:hypothetical protein H2248_007782 [Termitomyces sp. 'cryptogamus']|nr:hypothetical protein H2248_007782 [Termitomyces sp. 'cryptogamus']
MAEIRTHPNFPHIPDNISLPQFMLQYHHPLRPIRTDIACLIEDDSGRGIYFEELRNNTRTLASTLRAKYKIGENDVVMIISRNHMGKVLHRVRTPQNDLCLLEYPTALWAIHLLGGVVSCSNPQSTVEELLGQLILAKITFVIAHSSNVSMVLSAMHLAGLSSDRVILIDRMASVPRIPNVYDCIQEGVKNNFDFQERVFDSGEGKRKTALLSWSSGTTGKPKAVAISHYALIANIIQMTAHTQVEKAHCFRNVRGFRPGDVAIGVLPFYHVAGLMISLHLTLFCAMSVVVIERYSILSTLESIVRHQITHLILVPPLAVELCKHPAVRNHDLSRVKYMIIAYWKLGAAPVPKEVQTQLCELFPDAQIGQAYGLTEMTTTLAMISGTQKRGPVGSGGRLLPGLQARVIKQDGSLANYGESGQLVVKGPAIALGYLNNKQATQDTFVDGYNVWIISFKTPADVDEGGFIRATK